MSLYRKPLCENRFFGTLQAVLIGRLLDSPIKGFPEKKSEQSYVVVAVIYAT